MANGGIIGPVNTVFKTDKITTFTSSGTFTPRLGAAASVDYLVIAGGGSGGSDYGGGGGAGGHRSSFPGGTKLNLSAGPHAVTIGAGGAGRTADQEQGLPGNPSTISSITSTAGGGGGTEGSPGPVSKTGLAGGSGGGGSYGYRVEQEILLQQVQLKEQLVEQEYQALV